MSPIQLRARLLHHQGLTIAEWARRNGHNPNHAQRVIHRWCSRTSGVPRGRATRAILRDLSRDVGAAIPPTVDWKGAA